MHDPAPGFEAPPQHLVENGRQRFGRFHGPAVRANLLDASYRRLPRALRRWRLKEWQAVQIASPDLFVNVALFDAKLLQLLQVKIYDRARGQKHLHERQLRPGAFRIADQLVDSSNAYRDRKSALRFDNRLGAGRIEVEIDLQARRDCPRITGRLVLHTDRGASQIVSLPLSGEIGMYSHKGMFPVDGELTIGADTYQLTAQGVVGLLDDHKGYYPYVMSWDWVTSANRDGRGRALGFNLTRNQCRDPETFNENCAWIDDRIGRLPAVTVERDRPRQEGERWRIRDRDGRVDLQFEPTVPGDVRINALVIESRYRGPFGRFTGRLEPEGLEPIAVEDWFGMGEEFWLRC
ncbi:MAG TPA: DUF2804 domain-containing protein [Kofleriaceae bacterium]|nr:DUF2804 domain-containing protein [Kofleriaceae bacterium]